MIYYYLLWLVHTYLIITILTGEYLPYLWKEEVKVFFLAYGVGFGLMGIVIGSFAKVIKKFIKAQNSNS